MKTLSKLFFFLCLPGIIWHAPLKAEIPLTFDITEDYSNFSPWDLLKYETLSFDRIINFIKMIGYTDNLEDIFTEQQMEETQNGIRSYEKAGTFFWIQQEDIGLEDIEFERDLI